MNKRARSLPLALWHEAWCWTIPLALVAGMAAQWLQLPAAWLVGPMLATLALALRGRAPATFPTPLFSVVQAVIGTTLSTSFEPLYLRELSWNWVPVLGVILAVLLLCLASAIVLTRVSDLSPSTAILGTVPGAASGMIALSDELGGDARIVAFMQYARMLIVVILTSLTAHFLLLLPAHSTPSQSAAPIALNTLPPLVEYTLTVLVTAGGAWLGLRLRLPAGALIGSLVAGIMVKLLGIQYGIWPPGTLQVTYILMGINVGRRFDRAALQGISRLVPLVLIQVLVLVLGSSLCGIFLAWATGVDLLSGYLATNPGGLDSVAVVALDSGANMSLVLATQMLRFCSVILAGPPVVSWLTRRMAARVHRAA